MTAQPLPFEVTAPSSAIPDALRQAILRALSKEADGRQDNAKEFFAELSSGGGITVDEPAAVSSDLARAGTAAMAAAPDFAAMAGTAGPVSPPVAAPPQHQPHAAPAMAAPVAAPPPPQPQKSGGGKGLIIGLVAIGGLLLIGIVVVAAQQMKPSSEEDQPLTNPFTSTSGQTTIAPQVDPTGSAPTEATGTGDTPDPSPKPTSKPTSKPTTGPKPTTKPTTKPQADGCPACISAAQSGNIMGAAAAMRRCTDPVGRSTCQKRARGNAARAAQSAARNGNCAQAKAIQNAARGMGAGSGALEGALNGTSCK